MLLFYEAGFGGLVMKAGSTEIELGLSIRRGRDGVTQGLGPGDGVKKRETEELEAKGAGLEH